MTEALDTANLRSLRRSLLEVVTRDLHRDDEMGWCALCEAAAFYRWQWIPGMPSEGGLEDHEDWCPFALLPPEDLAQAEAVLAVVTGVQNACFVGRVQYRW